MDRDRRITFALSCWLVFLWYRLWMTHVRGTETNDSRHVDFMCAAETYGLQYNMLWARRHKVLVLAGGVLPVAPDEADAAWYAGQHRRLDAWLGDPHTRALFPHRIVVWGASDVPPGTTAPPRLSNATVLFDSSCEVDGLTVYGASWQPLRPGGGFYLPRGSAALEAKWRGIPPQVDVVVTHTPPAGLGDRQGRATETEVHEAIGREAAAAAAGGNESGVPESATAGCALLHRRLEEVRPRLVVAGLVADGYGVTRGGLTVLNPSLSSPEASTVRPRPLKDPTPPHGLRAPLRWSLLGPDRFPKVRGVEVPFVIE